jgi:hypothetical protein
VILGQLKKRLALTAGRFFLWQDAWRVVLKRWSQGHSLLA